MYVVVAMNYCADRSPSTSTQFRFDTPALTCGVSGNPPALVRGVSGAD